MKSQPDPNEVLLLLEVFYAQWLILDLSPRSISHFLAKADMGWSYEAIKSKMTTPADILTVLRAGERISYTTLVNRLRKAGKQPRGMLFALNDSAFEQRWHTGELYSSLHVFDEKNRGPLYISLAP